MDIVTTIILLILAVFFILFYIWRIITNSNWPRWYTPPPTLKELKKILKYKPKKKFYEDGYADEIDEEEHDNNCSRR